MPQAYVTDETKQLLDIVAAAEKRTNDAEINFLLTERAKELGLPDVTPPSVSNGDTNNHSGQCQEKNGGGNG